MNAFNAWQPRGDWFTKNIIKVFSFFQYSTFAACFQFFLMTSLVFYFELQCTSEKHTWAHLSHFGLFSIFQSAFSTKKKRVKDPFAKMSNFFLLSIFEAICSLSLICWRQLLWNLCSKIVSIPKCSKIAHNKSFHSWCEIFAHLGNIGGLHSI